MTVIQRLLGLAALVLFLAATNRVQADTSFPFTYSDGTNIAYGLLQASYNGDGTFTATSGTLYVTGGLVVGTYSLYPNPVAPDQATSPSGAFFYDNVLYPGQDPALDQNGLLFTGNGLEINIWGNGPGTPYSFMSFDGSFYNISDSGTFTLALNPAQEMQNLKAAIQALVTSGVTLPAVGQSLYAKLDAALAALEAGDTATAITKLQDFINQVEAFVKAGKLTTMQGQSLINAAQAILAIL